MDRIWAPWRKKFLTHPLPKRCIFCRIPRSNRDRENLVVCRGRSVFSMLNLYPYNNGHILISPYRHLAAVERMSEKEMAELFAVMKSTLKKLKKILKPQGFNIGFNVGRAAGAGFEGHVHLHIVPRWQGDTNFMPVLSGDKVISESLDALRKRLVD